MYYGIEIKCPYLSLLLSGNCKRVYKTSSLLPFSEGIVVQMLYIIDHSFKFKLIT